MDLRLIPSAGIVIRPLVATDRSNNRRIKLCSSDTPLSLTTWERSMLWRQHLAERRSHAPRDVLWARRQIEAIVNDHSKRESYQIRDADLLRVSGAFNKLGVDLGEFKGDDLGCQNSCFRFGKFPPYRCDVLLKADASFLCRNEFMTHNPRAVVVSLKPDAPNLLEFVDVIALTVLAEELRVPCRN